MITTDALSSPRREAVLHLLDAVARHDGVDPVDEAGRMALTAGPALHLLLPAPGAEDPDAAPPIGYAGLLADGTVQGAVHPGHRRRGHGRALLAAALERRGDAGVWSHGDLSAARGLLTGAGLSETRRLLVLGRDLDPADPVAVPPVRGELDVRPYAGGRDAEDWLHLNATAFADHPEQGRLTRADLDRRTAEDWFDPEDLLLGRTDGELVGSVWTKRTTPAAAEIYVVATAPSAQGRGIAGHLMGTTLRRLAGQGVRSVHLYVEGDNTPALALYDRWGMTVTATHVQWRRTAVR